MRNPHRIAFTCLVLGTLFAFGNPVAADATYAIADAAAELAVSIDPGEAMVWMNTFPVDPAGTYVDAVKMAYGRVGGPSSLNGLSIRVLVYEDANGGSPQDAVLKWSTSTVIANANTNTLNTYRLPATLIHGNLVAAVFFDNQTALSKAIAALDTTAPTLAGSSYLGFAEILDPANLGGIPAAQWGTIEGFGSVGNFRIEAHGRNVDDGAVSLLIETAQPAGLTHLGWAGAAAAYDVERASVPDFSDGDVIATGLAANSYGDPTLGDGRTWFYRVR